MSKVEVNYGLANKVQLYKFKIIANFNSQTACCLAAGTQRCKPLNAIATKGKPRYQTTNLPLFKGKLATHKDFYIL
ncbi:hypothetical protein [Ruminococcus sp.]|uniref:hypothetical protein n=1 Tax=Ruminococcus sp. TaxID=41978 RepID=UPI003521576B